MLAHSTKVPRLRLISDYVPYHAKRTPAAIAMTLGGNQVTYLELAKRVSATARAMLAGGVKPGDRVAMLANSTPDFMVHFLASASIGAIWMGLNPKYRFKEFHYVVTDAEPSSILVHANREDRNYVEEMSNLQQEVSSVLQIVDGTGESISEGAVPYDEWLAAGDNVSDEMLQTTRSSVEDRAPALLVYTSGTTGQPKGALLPHSGLITAARTQFRYWGADPLVMQNYFPINHLACVGDVSLFVFINGGTIAFMEQFEVGDVIRQIGSEDITCWAGIPTTFQMCLDHPDWKNADTSSVQVIAFGGAAAPRPLVEQLVSIVPRVSNAYGQTESVAQVTFTPPCDDVDLLVDTIGKPVPDYEVRIAHEDGTEADAGEVGEIRIRGDFLMNGYWRRPEATAETLVGGGWLRTGDLARLRPDGNFAIVGRIREMFKSGGYNVYPLEVEQVLESLDGVSAAIVVPVPDRIFSEVGHAFIQKEPGYRITDSGLQEHCRESLANYKIPKTFFFVDELPLLPVGKVDRRAVKALALSNLELSVEKNNDES